MGRWRQGGLGRPATSGPPYWLLAVVSRGVLLRAARILGLALVPVLSPDLGDLPVTPYLLLVALVALFGLWQPFRGSLLVEGAGALVLTLAAGTLATLFLPYLAVLVVAIGRRHDLPAGVLGGVCLSMAQLAPLFWASGVTSADLPTVVTTFAFLPLLGATAGMWSRVVGAPPAGRRVLQETNRVLRELVQLSADAPGGLSASPIGAAAVQDVAETTGSPLVVLYEVSGGSLELRASEGSRHETLPDHLDWSDLPFSDDDEPSQLVRPTSGDIDLGALRPLTELFDPLLLVPITRDGIRYGVLLVAGEMRKRLGYLHQVAADTALALENATLFQRARDAAADATRDALAHDLHDGVAQSLTHLRLELQLLATLLEDPEAAEQAERLSRVAARAVTDLRATIDVLRTDTADDLVHELSTSLRDLDGVNATKVEFQHDLRVQLDGAFATQLRFVAQEAVSNAVRHGGASVVRVGLRGDDQHVVLEIEDDGRGIPTDGPRGSGLGMTAMTRRAARLGASLDVADRAGGGTVVRLDVPLDSSGAAAGPPTASTLGVAGRLT